MLGPCKIRCIHVLVVSVLCASFPRACFGLVTAARLYDAFNARVSSSCSAILGEGEGDGENEVEGDGENEVEGDGDGEGKSEGKGEGKGKGKGKGGKGKGGKREGKGDGVEAG